MTSIVASEQLFDLWLLGLTWLREDKPEILARPGSSIFGALRCAGVISESQRRTLATNTKLIGHAMANSEIIKAPRRPRKPLIDARIGISDMKILTLVVPTSSLQYAKFFGAKGYLHVITECGIQHAKSVESNYSALIDHERFAQGWLGFRSQMIALASRKGSPKNPSSGKEIEDEKVTLPAVRAPYAESDFEW